ncbi:hypothetical protein [Nannocystis punicea]|uniref:Uncharacterized protein n=1 Tax=Nannocystis punicea TaxID=2995304 RepID=A0ABY7GWV4_9BACT|nr:hypothetical protein [Nannocystis poenicansa]WAS91463.1 hypothetical protein O0S08_35215 [Nannocystis poenicansa]
MTTGGSDDGSSSPPSASTGDGGSESTGDVPDVVCPKTHDGVTSDGHPVVVCDELFADTPYVRPPVDSGSIVHAATDGHSIFIRGEDPRLLETEELAVMGLDIDGTVELRRYGYAIYRVTLDDTDRVTASVPAILVPDAAFFGFLAGRAAEGVISHHAPDPDDPAFEYEVEPTLPVRVRFTTVADGDADPAIEPLIKETLAVVVENAEAPVLGSTGQCLPALTAAGAENPFDGADLSTLVAERVPSMHAPGDNEFVLSGAAPLNHMTPAWIVLPHQLLLADATIVFPEADFSPHGNPLAMPRLRLTAVDGGGGDCTP